MRTLVISLALFAGAGCKKGEPTPAETPREGRVIVMSVTEKGFEPSKITVAKDQPVTLIVTRKTEATCASELLIAGTDINVPLPLGQPAEIRWTPTKSGAVKFGCAMDKMVSGVLIVE